MPPGSDHEPPAPDAAEQMREVVERLRDRAWMVAPVTSHVPNQPDRLDAER